MLRVTCVIYNGIWYSYNQPVYIWHPYGRLMVFGYTYHPFYETVCISNHL